MTKKLLALVSIVMPWKIRRQILRRLFGYEIDESASIGLSWTFPADHLKMGPGTRIGHFNVIHTVDRVVMDEGALIGGFNWISANLSDYTNPEVENRRPQLLLGPYSGITTRHYIDCSDTIEIGEFALVAGLRSVLLTHHMDVERGRQGCGPIVIGAHCFVSTNCVLLGNAELPDHSILAAGSVLIDRPGPSFRLYAGSPAREKKEYPEDLGWFERTPGSVAELRKRWSR